MWNDNPFKSWVFEMERRLGIEITDPAVVKIAGYLPKHNQSKTDPEKYQTGNVDRLV